MINLDLFNSRTDLACENEKYQKEEFKLNGCNIVKSYHNDDIFFSIYTDAVINNISDEIKKIPEIIDNILKQVLKHLKINESSKALVVGLGNDKITPDALGPRCIDRILVTKHLFDNDEDITGLRNVSSFSPSVMGNTGMETSLIIESIVQKFKPDFLIVIDALASINLNRVNQTIQISTKGICPGSGIGNSRKEISFKTMGVPVISVGVPTVVDVASITNDVINFILNHIHKEIINPSNPLLFMPNNQNVSVPKEQKNKYIGLIGNLNEDELRRLIFEAIAPTGYNFMVTTKDIDQAISNFAMIISRGINLCLHQKVNSTQ